eukprot:8965074-Alexandrium_andersonii.AAC.1
MSASLVGSEMCIRDSYRSVVARISANSAHACQPHAPDNLGDGVLITAVSYTHLTLPTICSV